MSNPLYGMMNQMPMMNPLMQKLQQFSQMFRGDPKAQVEQMLSSGRVSQAQYNQAVQMAQQIQRMIGKR